MESLAIIPARGGSKGIPNKNIRPLGDKPLIGWTIDAALSSEVGRVVVSSDSQRILSTAGQWGVLSENLIKRPPDLATDGASVDGAEHHALKVLEERDGYIPDIVMRLQPTQPFRTSKHINEALRLLTTGDTAERPDAILGVCEMPKHPFLAVRANADGWLQHDTRLFQPRQKYPPALAINGAMYAARLDYYLEHGFYGPRCLPLAMGLLESWDIDEELELRMAHAFFMAGMV